MREESNPLRFLLAPFTALLVLIFVRRQPYCKFAPRLSEKGAQDKLFDLPNLKFFGGAKSKNAVILTYYK